MFPIMSFFVCFFSALIAKKLDKTIWNPLTLFCILWSTILLFSAQRGYGLDGVSDRTYFLILLGITFFSLTYLISSYLFSRRRNVIDTNKKFSLNSKLIWILIVLTTIYYCYYFLLIFSSVKTFSLWSVQQYVRNTDPEMIVTNNFVRLFGSFAAGPVSTALPIVVVSNLFSKKRDLKLFLATIILIIIKMCSTASRSSLLFIFIYVIAAACLHATEVNVLTRKFNINWKLILLVLVGVIVFILLSLSRQMSIWKNFYLDFAIPPIMFERWSNNIDISNIYGYGTASLSGFCFPFLYIIQNIFGMNSLPFGFDNVYSFIDQTVSEWIWVGNGIPANAYVSLFWFFYLDFREIGIVLGSIIFSIYCAYTFERYMYNKNQRSLSMCLLMISCISFSFVRMQFALPNFALSFLLLNLFFVKTDSQNIKK